MKGKILIAATPVYSSPDRNSAEMELFWIFTGVTESKICPPSALPGTIHMSEECRIDPLGFIEEAVVNECVCVYYAL